MRHRLTIEFVLKIMPDFFSLLPYQYLILSNVIYQNNHFEYNPLI
jgi:hypothetical protein